MELVLPVQKFPHTRPVVGHSNFTSQSTDSSCYIDQSLVEHKFAVWDHVVRNNLLESKDLKVRAQAFRLLKDKTIFAYNFLRFDNNPVKMLYLQDAVLNDPSDRVLFCGCNQHIGKSFTLNVDAATSFMMDHGKGWVGILVSGSLPQSQYQMDRIKMLLKSSGVKYRVEDTLDTKTGKKDNTTQLSYTFYGKDKKTPLYRNLLICCPHSSSALGYPADVLWLDEFDFWENCDQEHFLYQVAIPRTFRTKGKIKIYTNPDGKEKMLYKLWTQQLPNGNPAWHRYQFNYWDKPGANQPEFDKLVVGMTRQRVESTLLAVFTRTEGSFFSSSEIKDMLDPELVEKGDSAGYGKEVAFFLDVGSVHDQSTLVGAYLEPNEVEPEIPLIKLFYVHKYPVGYPISRVVGIDSAIDMQDGWSEEAADNPSVRQVLGEYAEEYDGKKYFPLFGFDNTGQAGLIPLFQAAGIDAVGIKFSGPKKWHMYQRFQYYVQQRFIKRGKERDSNTVRGCNFDYQMSKLVVKKGTNTSYKQVHHENESDLDDLMDSVAGVIHLIENPDLPSLSFELLSPDKVPMSTNLVEPSQYIPSYVNKAELRSWVEDRELRRN